jgi:plasmid stability protein
MATLKITRLSKELYDALEGQAAEHGLSMEAEARSILVAAFSPTSLEPHDRVALGNEDQA